MLFRKLFRALSQKFLNFLIKKGKLCNFSFLNLQISVEMFFTPSLYGDKHGNFFWNFLSAQCFSEDNKYLLLFSRGLVIITVGKQGKEEGN